MQNADDDVMNGTVPNHRDPNDRDPARVLTHDNDEDVSEENVMLEEQSDLHPNASNNADTELQAEYDDLGNLFDEVETPMLSDGDMASRAKLIELQRSDQLLENLFELA